MSKESNIYDLIIIGAGFAGLYSLYKAIKRNIKVCVFEKGSDVGGTWYWNRYPGARCDVESMQYSYQFSKELEQEWKWTEQYATQPEILKYAKHVAKRYNLKPHIKFNNIITSSHFDKKSRVWNIKNRKGEQYKARFCIMATGCLSSIYTPLIKGASSFKPCTF